ncbi:hypothetical protein NEOC65_001792 [Neochlamydia sp. AcF65]|nr:hypothetical protein [Neochlamydia sp. AcF65]MBS4171511.1 hypothetical protein [Neochlamydia sp. AcF95]
MHSLPDKYKIVAKNYLSKRMNKAKVQEKKKAFNN